MKLRPRISVEWFPRRWPFFAISRILSSIFCRSSPVMVLSPAPALMVSMPYSSQSAYHSGSFG